MIDPIEQAMRELDEAVKRRDLGKEDCPVGTDCIYCRQREAEVARLRERYNAAIIAYDGAGI